MADEDYPDGVNDVIQRFIDGDIPVKTKHNNDPARGRDLPPITKTHWADSAEEAEKELKKTKKRDANYYERLERLDKP